MLTVDLYPYQEADVDRMLSRSSFLLAYEMGLGKTIMSVAVTESLLGDGRITSAVVVVPANLKWQWAKALASATDMTTREVFVCDEDGVKRPIVVPTEDSCVVIGGLGQTAAKRAEQLRGPARQPP